MCIRDRLCTGFLALATVVTALPTTPVHAESKQYWTESAEPVSYTHLRLQNAGRAEACKPAGRKFYLILR